LSTNSPASSVGITARTITKKRLPNQKKLRETAKRVLVEAYGFEEVPDKATLALPRAPITTPTSRSKPPSATAAPT
jgi:hypothetical protein